jgi:hypothetical protein
MTDRDRENLRILDEHAAEIQALVRTCGAQHAIAFANRLIDTAVGIVAADGHYYPRDGYSE